VHAVQQQEEEIAEQRATIERQERELAALRNLLCREHPDEETCRTAAAPR
jgi:hypothetical protein